MAKSKISDKVFSTNRPFFLRERVNDMLIEHGVQKGRELLRLALAALHKIQWGDRDVFPAETGECEWWMRKLSPVEASDLYYNYSAGAASLAYRYLRKKRGQR